MPPTEKRGRIQTSTVTVAVLDPDKPSSYKLDESDVEIRASRGSGPGGQNRNKTDSCITVVHRPTGTTVRVDMRSQHQSKELALRILAARLAEEASERHQAQRDHSRRQQVGSGMRGDKVRTYRTQDDRVTDHRTGQTWKLKSWVRGDWD